MQEFGLALVPVLAGYWLLTHTHLLKHPYETRTHHRVFFEPAVAGGGLLFVAWLVAGALAPVFDPGGTLGWAGDLWRALFGFEHSAVLALTVTFALAFPPLVNWKINALTAENRWALHNETVRGRILRESLEQGVLVEVHLRGGQSHIGFVSTSPRPDFEGDFALAPELSGHRDPVTHKLIITSEYDDQPATFRIVCLLDKVAFLSLRPGIAIRGLGHTLTRPVYPPKGAPPESRRGASRTYDRPPRPDHRYPKVAL